MPSSYTSDLRLELMADGEKESLWGEITNTNLEILGRAASGVTTVSLAGITDTITVDQGTLSEGHYSVLVMGGSPTGTNTVTISPNTVARIYLVNNVSGQAVIFTQGSGGNATIANGDVGIIYSDGAGATAAVVDLTAGLTRSSEIAETTLPTLGISATAAEINTLDGFTGSVTDHNYAAELRATGVTAAEFDKLDGLLATTAELNILDGVTATTAELNILDGVTATTAELNILDGFTGTVADLNYAKDLRATGVTTAEFDKLDGLTATTTELNYVDGVTSPVQTQLNTKALDNPLTQAEAEDDTSTVFGQVSGQRLAQAGVVSFTDQEQQIGVGQTWQAFPRGSGTVYQNNTGRPIACTCILNATGDTAFYVSPDNITFTKLDFGNGSSGTRSHAFAIVPNGHYYYYGSIAFGSAVELR